MTTTELRKSITYDRATRDYAMYYEGQLIGFASTSHEAEITFNQYVYDLLTHGGCATATALDGGQAPACTVCHTAEATVYARPSDEPVFCYACSHEPPPEMPSDDEDDNFGGWRTPRLGHTVIAQPRLIEHVIPLTSASTVALQNDDAYVSLIVDGRTYPLVMCKFMHGRPEIKVAINAAFAQVQAAIAGLNAPACTTCGDDGNCPDCEGQGRTPNISCTGDAARGWADTCDACNGTGKVSPRTIDDPLPDPGPGGPGVPGDDRPRCVSCHTTDYVPSALLPHTCLHCSNARYFGFRNRFDAQQHAVTLQSITIHSRLFVCKNCQGIHDTQHCPDLWAALRADVALGRELCAMQWRQHTSFIAMLINADEARRRHYAFSYVAFIRAHNPATTLTGEKVLARWAREMEPEPVAMELAA